MDSHELPEKKSKTLVLKKLKKLQERLQFNKVRNTMQNKNEIN